MDNFKFDVTSEGKTQLLNALRLPFHRYKFAVGYTLTESTMVLYWSNTGVTSIIEFPFKMDLEGSVDFVWRWLEQADIPGRAPDIDGDVSKGFHAFCDGWGHAGGTWAGFAAIHPIYAMSGK